MWKLRKEARIRFVVGQAIKYGKRFCHFMLPRSRLTDWLVSGVDSHVAAKLAGHQDTKMIDQVYSHVADDYEFMLREAGKQTKAVGGERLKGSSWKAASGPKRYRIGTEFL